MVVKSDPEHELQSLKTLSLQKKKSVSVSVGFHLGQRKPTVIYVPWGQELLKKNCYIKCMKIHSWWQEIKLQLKCYRVSLL